MSFEDLQAHFGEEPVVNVGPNIYRTSKLQVRDRYKADLDNLAQVKAGMNGLVTPFVLAERIKAREYKGKKWFFFPSTSDIEFVDPLISEATFVQVDLADLLRKKSEYGKTLNLVLAWANTAVARGFLPINLDCSNFVFSFGRISCDEPSSVLGQVEGRQQILDDESSFKDLAKNAADSYRAVVPDVDLVEAFQRRYLNILRSAHYTMKKDPWLSYPVSDPQL